MRDRLISILLFVLVSSIYYATSAGITSSNDGSHYALLRAMVDEGRFSIETYAHFAEGNDLSIRDEVIYSDRPPGTAVLGAPFYVVGGVLLRPIRDLPTRHDEGNPRLAYLMMFPAIAGAGAVMILFRLLRLYGLSMFAALTTALAYAFGSTLFKYSGVLFSHAPSALLVMGGIALALNITREGVKPGVVLFLGIVLGLSVVVEYSNVLFVGMVLVYLIITAIFPGNRIPRLQMQSPLKWAGDIGLLTVGVTLPLVFLLTYNAANFGSPFTTSYQYAINYPWAASFRSTFDGPIMQGLAGMLWYGHDALGEENQGLFLLIPITLIGLAEIWAYLHKWGREAALTLSVFGVYLLLFSAHHTFSGFSADGRYLIPFLGLWFIPVGFALYRLGRLEESAVRAAAFFTVYGLLFLSIRNMLAHIAFSYNYHLDPGLVARRAATPENWRYILGDIFVNAANLPLLWLVQAVVGGIGIAAARLIHLRWGGGAAESPPAAPEV